MFGNPIHGYLPFVSGNVSFDFPCVWAMVVRRRYYGPDKTHLVQKITYSLNCFPESK